MNENLENNISEIASDVVSGVEQAPKKKGGKIAAVAVGAVVLAGGGGAVAYNCSDYVKNQVKLATLDPQEYYAWVTEENSKELSKSVSDSYNEYVKALEDGQSAEFSIKYVPSDSVKQLFVDSVLGQGTSDDEAVKQFTDSVNAIEAIEIGSSAQTKKNSASGNVYVSLNDDKLISADFLAEQSALEYFFRIPELNDKWLGISVDDLTGGEELADVNKSTQAMEAFFENPEELISAKEIDQLITKYTGIWAESIKDVELEKKETVDICDISVEYTAITAEINEKKAMEIAEKFVTEVSEDKLIKEIVTERLESCTADEFDTALEETLTEIKESEPDEDGESVNFITYVDAKGTIRGMALEAEENETISFVIGLEDDDVRGKFEFKDGEESVVAELTAVKDGKKYDGEVTIEAKTEEYDYETDESGIETTKFSVEFTDFEIVDEEKGYMNGEFTFVIPEIDPISFTLSSDGKSQEIEFVLNIEDTDYGKFVLGLSSDKYDESKVPSADNAVMFTEDFAIEDYTNEEEVTALITEALKKLGCFSDEDSAVLAEQAAQSLFGGMNEDVGIIGGSDSDWDDEEFEFDDEDIDWDDEDLDFDDEDLSFETDSTIAPGEAFITVADESYMAYFFGDEYDTLKGTPAKLNGDGTYTIKVENIDAEITPEGFSLLAFSVSEPVGYENATITVDSIKIDGKDVALTEKNLETVYNDISLDGYFYSGWSDEGIFDGASVEAWGSVEITFTVAGSNVG